MQLMSWMMSRLGSRFTLLFEPYRRRVMHSAMGRFLDQPMDLAVGLVEPDGTRRVLPFTTEHTQLYNCEQFDRFNSITFRGYSERYRLRLEFNVHSVFWPQDPRLSLMPAFYLELRINPIDKVRWIPAAGPRPEECELFITLRRPDTFINADAHRDAGWIDLEYQNHLLPHLDAGAEHEAVVAPDPFADRKVQVHEKIVSLNAGAEPIDDRHGLKLKLPVAAEGTGVKWRLVWGAHVGEPVLKVRDPDGEHEAKFNYTDMWGSVNDVVGEAIEHRDDRLALSRRFEKLIEQAPLDLSQRHLLNHSWQNYTSNTFWCRYQPQDKPPRPWFSVWEGSCFFHSTIDVEYNISPLYLCLWPQLLRMQLDQWSWNATDHEPSGGAFLSHDIGAGAMATGQRYPHPMEVEENCNYLLLLQAYVHWTGQKDMARKHAGLVKRLADYLLWTDRDGSGFPSVGVANTIDDASPAVQFARKQTYLAVKRLASLRAAADLCAIAGDDEAAAVYESRWSEAVAPVEQAAWLGDHYAVAVDPSADGVVDPWTGEPLAADQLNGWDAYSIYTGNGLVLPAMIGQPPLLKLDRLKADVAAADRENQDRYGDGHTSAETSNIWISQNLWRDTLARYLKLGGPSSATQYWDMQIMSNTHDQSHGFIDTYINNNLSFYPRGIAAMGWFIASPRLQIDRLAPGGSYITLEPERHAAARWPLLALADWKAGKVPVCVVNDAGQTRIESATDPVILHGSDPDQSVSGVTVIG
jgi:hypothetical protein